MLESIKSIGNNRNQRLYHYGQYSDFKQSIGKGIVSFGMMTFAVLLFGGFLVIGLVPAFIFAMVVGFGIMFFGVVIIQKAKAERFDYQMQSGTILHKGDWN